MGRMAVAREGNRRRRRAAEAAIGQARFLNLYAGGGRAVTITARWPGH